MAEVPKPPNLAVRGGVWFQIGSQQLHVGVELDHRPALKAHPAFLVRDLEAMQERFRSAGVETWSDEPLAGHRRFYSRDPFGNRLEFIEPLGESGSDPRADSPTPKGVPTPTVPLDRPIDNP
jgi:catechol 2,3-dioxygenase-like lactoylglutathione lyase family enzyme